MDGSETPATRRAVLRRRRLVDALYGGRIILGLAAAASAVVGLLSALMRWWLS